MLSFPSVLDNTMIRAWRACPKKFWWGYMRNLHPTDESIHLLAGAAFAKGLEVTRKSFYDLGEDFDTALARGAAALIQAYGAFEADQWHENKAWDRLLGALGHYFIEWPITGPIVPFRAPGAPTHAIEYSFAVPIPGVKHPENNGPLIYAGRFDFVGDYNGIRLGVDDKTTSQLGKSWLTQWVLPNQLLGYTWGARETGQALAGFEVRGTSLLKNSYGHMADTKMFPRWKVELFERELIATIQEMIRDWERDYWRMDLASACSAYSGCPFLMLCDSPSPEDWIPVNFIERVWDPLASRD